MASSGPIPSWLMLVAALGGLPFTWGIAYSFYAQNKQQRNWPQVEGKVIRSGLTERTRNINKVYQLDVHYEYWVNGRRYESDSVDGMTTYYSSKSRAQSKADEYPVGRAVTALVNPDRPEEAFLEWGHSWWAIALAFFLGLVWAGAWLAGWYSAYLAPYLRGHGWIR